MDLVSDTDCCWIVVSVADTYTCFWLATCLFGLQFYPPDTSDAGPMRLSLRNCYGWQSSCGHVVVDVSAVNGFTQLLPLSQAKAMLEAMNCMPSN